MDGPNSMAEPSTNSLSAVCKAWADLDLESMRVKLDDTGLRIAEFQDEAMQNRRKLAEATREFKKSAGDTPVKGLGPLLKQYQEEIDRLTKRCKHGETAFLEVYQKLYEAPDPAPALALAFETASRAAELEAQTKKLSAELSEYKAEAASIKNQDLTIRRLEDKIRGLEAALEEKGLEIDEVRVQAVAEADAARMAQMQEREAQLTAMLTEAQASLAVMQKLHTATQNQLFAMQSQSEDERMGRQTELDLASVELERAQERLLSLEREKQQLQHRLQRVSGSGAGDQQDLLGAAVTVPAVGLGSALEESMRQELYVQREVAGRLRLEVTSLRRELDDANTMWEARVDGLRASMQATEQHARALEDQLAMRPTNQLVEELRSQIRMLQAVGYNSLAEDDADGDGNQGGSGGSRLAAGSMEAMLLQKNRHLDHTLTMNKLQLVDTKTQLDAAVAQVVQLQTQLGEQAALIAQLEEDLMESRKGWAPQPAETTGDKAQRVSSTKAPLSAFLSDADGGDGSTGVDDAGDDASQSSMIRVVCGQRDRFRARANELEEELQRIKQELVKAKSEAAASKADNIALVERLRFVHGFKAQQRGTGDVEVGADAERRYGRLYDEGINPFKEFQGEQRERQKSNLHFADKLMYMFGQLVFGSTGARLGTFTYLVIMHLLVVGSLMRMTHHSSDALYEHSQQMLESRHDMMIGMHHDSAAPSIVQVLSPSVASGDNRLP